MSGSRIFPRQSLLMSPLTVNITEPCRILQSLAVEWVCVNCAPRRCPLIPKRLVRGAAGVEAWVLYARNSVVSAAAKSLQSCLTLCDPMDGSPPGSPIPGILQARTLEWVAISFSNAWKWKAKVKSLSRIRLFATPWTAAYQAPLSMGFSRQECWSGVPLPSPWSLLLALRSRDGRSQSRAVRGQEVLSLHLS